jgi:amino acid transporter
MSEDQLPGDRRPPSAHRITRPQPPPTLTDPLAELTDRRLQSGNAGALSPRPSTNRPRGPDAPSSTATAVPARPDTVRPELDRTELLRGTRPGDHYLRLTSHPDFRRARAGYLVAREGIDQPRSGIGRRLAGVKKVLIGRPLASARELHERVNVFTGLAVFASDNISSSAYATEEIMRVLILAGVGALTLTMPITIGIVLVLAIVVTSYQQTIRAYPSGGGSYIVASDNFGPLPGLVAAAALLADYVLTVAVSIAAGVAALTSIVPGLFEYRVLLGVAFVTLLCLGNLRGIRESGAIFTAPTYVYLVAMLGLLAYGMVRFATGSLPAYSAPDAWREAHGAQALGLLLILRAFASGSVALTGTEAVSNGVPAFKPPEARRAQSVLILMGACFASIFLGMSFLAGRLGILPDPSEQVTVVSQLAGTLVGTGTPYHYLVQFSTALLLVLAANTAFADFPRLASILARDRFLPRTFQFRGDRLAFTGGIIVLSAVAATLIIAFRGSVTNLIPLYTVGVFLAFTLSQSGMVRHWWRQRDQVRSWRPRAAINGIGAVTTGIVALEVAASKFLLGAWMVLLLIPLLIGVMWAIRRHYLRMDEAERPETPLAPADVRPRVIVPVAKLNAPALQALAFARAIVRDSAVTLVHITDSQEEAEALQAQWARLPHGEANLIVIESPFRSLAGPLLRYIDAVRESYPHDTMVIVLPEFVPNHWWEHLLHNQTALRLKAALLFRPGVVVANVPYHLASKAAVSNPG